MNKNEELSQAIATVERQISEAKSEVAKKALNGKLERLKEELKSGAKKGTSTLATLSSARKSVRKLASKDFTALIEKLSAKPEYAFLKGYSEGKLKDDLARVAKPMGYRFYGENTKKPTIPQIKKGLKDGTVYYEKRPRHSDVSRVVQLADGGTISEKEIKLATTYGKMLNDLNKQKQFNKKIEQNAKVNSFAKANGITIDNNNIIYVNGSKVAFIDKINQQTGQDKLNWVVKKFATGGSVGKIDDLQFKQIASMTGVRETAIKDWAKANNLSSKDVSNIMMGLGRKQIKAGDFSTAVVGNPNNEYSKEIIEYAKANKGYKMENGGNIESSIDKLYEKAGFINDDMNWQFKLLEMIQDGSSEAHDIYQGLSAEQKEEVLQELYEMDNDMGSYGDGDMETSRENLEIMLHDAESGHKYAEGGTVGDFFYDNRKDKTFQIIFEDGEKMGIRYMGKDKKPVGEIETILKSDFEYLVEKGAWGKYKQKYKDGGSIEKGYNNPEKATHVINIDGYNYYLEKIDSTHFYLSNNPDSRGMANHVAQHRGEPYYEEVRSWLKSTKFADGGNTGSKIADAKIKFRKLAKSNNFDIVVAEGRYEVELDANDKVKSIVHSNGNRHKASECPIYNKYKKEINHYIMAKYAEGGNIDNSYLGRTQIGKSFYGWKAETSTTKKIKGYDWEITTMKRYGGELVSTATGGKSEKQDGYSTFEYSPFEDPNYSLIRSKPKMVNEKAVTKQHEEALKIFIEKMNEMSGDKMATGGGIEKYRLFNFLQDDLATLQEAIKISDKQEIERFFSYWGQHLKSLKSEANKKMFNFLSDDLATLKTAIKDNDQEEIDKFFSYWGQHLESIKYATGGKVGEKTYNVMHNVGKSKYVVNFHNGVKTYSDGSAFFDIEIFKNLKGLKAFIKKLESEGYKKQMATGGTLEDNLLPPSKTYGENLQKAMEKFDISNNEARKRYGLYTIKQWSDLLGEKMENGGEVGDISKSEIPRMQKITKLKGLYGYMPSVNTVYYDSRTDKYYFEDFEGDFMELRNISTLEQLHKFLKENNITLDKKMATGGSILDNYEGRTPEDIWNNLSKSQRQHFLYDHRSEIESYKNTGKLPSSEIIKAYNSEWSTLDKDIKNRFTNHTREGQYATGGSVDGKKYSYLPNEDISKIVLKSGQIVDNKRILDGAYVKGSKAGKKANDPEMERAMRTLEKLKSEGKLKRFYDVRGNGKKSFETIIPNKEDKGYWKRYESASRGSLGILQNELLSEEDVLNLILKTQPKLSEDKDKMANGGSVSPYIDGMTEKEIMSATVVYDNGGETLDRYTVFTPDGSVYGMSETASGFNQYAGDESEIEKGSHLGKRLKTVPTSIRLAILDRMKEEEFARGGGITNDLSGNYYSSTDFVQTHDLMDLAKETFGSSWESGGDFDYDTEEIKMLIKKLGGSYKIVYVDSENREKFEEAKEKYFPQIKTKTNDGDIFVIPTSPKGGKMAKGGNAGYTYVPNEEISKLIAKDGKEYPRTSLLDGAYITDKVRTPKMSRTQFEDDVYSYGQGGGVGKREHSLYKKFGEENPKLVNFDLDSLDEYEEMVYDDFSGKLGKARTLQIIINNTEGDYTQLSPELAEIAEEQFPSDQFGDGGNIDQMSDSEVEEKYADLLSAQILAGDIDEDDIDEENELTIKEKRSFLKEYADEDDMYAKGGGIEYQNIKKEKEKMTTELFKECGVFFAFSDKQFEENKTPLKEGEKYVSIGGGGYLPKGKVDAFMKGMKAINSYGKQKVKKGNLQETEILYELQNHECFYTGDISDVVDLFEGTYTVKQIRDVYNKHREANQEYALGGEITAEEREKALKNYPKLNL